MAEGMREWLSLVLPQNLLLGYTPLPINHMAQQCCSSADGLHDSVGLFSTLDVIR